MLRAMDRGSPLTVEDVVGAVLLVGNEDALVKGFDGLAQGPFLPAAGISRMGADVARALVKLASKTSRSSQRHDRCDAALRTLARGSMASLASGVRALAAVDAQELRAAFEALAPGSGTTALDRLGARLTSLAGFSTLLPAAAAQMSGPPMKGPDAALTMKRPDLWLPLLLERVQQATDATTPDVDAALRCAEGSVDAWEATHLRKATAGSKTVEARKGTVSAASLALAMLDLHARNAEVPDPERPRALRAHVLDVVGHPSIAKDGPTRNAVLGPLFQLAALAERIPAGAPLWTSLRDTLASMREGKATASALVQLCSDVRAQHPSDDAAADRLKASLRDARGTEGLLRFREGILKTFGEGVERASMKRLTRALIDGSLPAQRRASLCRSRFEAAKLDDRALEGLFERYAQGARVPAREVAHGARFDDLELLDTDDVLDWSRAVDDVTSCQRTDGSPVFNRGLLNRFEDGSVRLLAVRDPTGKTVGRAALRLVTVEDGRLSLFLDAPYTRSEKTASLMKRFAKQRADALGVPLVVPSFYETRTPATPRTVRFPPLLATDYVDAGRLGVVDTAWSGGVRLQCTLAEPTLVEASA
jgi:hypothetical protein